MPTTKEWVLVFSIYALIAIVVIGGFSILIFWLITR